jgi:hypothetical protein
VDAAKQVALPAISRARRPLLSTSCSTTLLVRVEPAGLLQ